MRPLRPETCLRLLSVLGLIPLAGLAYVLVVSAGLRPNAEKGFPSQVRLAPALSLPVR